MIGKQKKEIEPSISLINAEDISIKEEKYNSIELEEKDGKGRIKIDNTEIKNVLDYEIKRGTNKIELTIHMSVPPEKLKTIY